MRVAFQLDKLNTLDLEIDSTIRLIKEGLKHGHAIYIYQPEKIYFSSKKILCEAINYQSQEVEILDLNKVDLVLIRQDPPYDMNYLTYTYFLEKLDSKVKIVNDPKKIRDFPEKLAVFEFPEFCPKTLITRNIKSIKSFINNQKKIVIKPLYSFGGEGVFLINKDDENIDALIEVLFKSYKEPFILQEFLPEVKNGDKRVVIIHGEVVGSILRVPEKNQIRANMCKGGTASISELTTKEQEIANKVAKFCKKNSIAIAGIDLIDKYLIEINLTSPTGLSQLQDLSNYEIDPAKSFWSYYK